MTREEGIRQINEAQWQRDDDGVLSLYVNTQEGRKIQAWLSMRPPYCDRGHIQLNIEGPLDLDRADSFPRFFFSFEEADVHTRTFLKWRIWKERTHPYSEICGKFGKQEEDPADPPAGPKGFTPYAF